MKYRWIMAAAVALTAIPATPAMAVESASCQGGEPHAGRQFTLTSQTSPITGNYSYAWDLDGNGTFETDTGTESTVKVEKATPGTYTFGIRVTDNDVPAGQAGRQASGTCEVKVVNDRPFPRFEAHPVAESFPVAYEALRFTYTGSDGENDVNQSPLTHAIDFDGDGQFEFTDKGSGEVFASFPAGFDRDVTHRITDDAGESVDTKLRIKTADNPFGFGGTSVIAPVGRGALPAVTVNAPKKIKRKSLLKGGLKVTFSWGPTWGRAEAVPSIGKTSGFYYKPDSGYAPGQRLTIKPFPPQLKAKAKPGKKLVLRWEAKGQEGAAQTGKVTVKITR